MAGKKQTKARQKQLAKQRRDRQQREKKAEAARPLFIPSEDVTKNVPQMDYDATLKAIAANDPRVWDEFMKFLGYFETHHYTQYGKSSLKRINVFVSCLQTALMKEGFSPDMQQAVKLTQMGHLIQHVVASSCYLSTNSLLDCVLPMEGNVPKIFMLQNPRCDIQLNQEKLFDINPVLASLWYCSYLLGLSSPTELIQKNLFRHLHNMDERWEPPTHVVSGLYFSSTYHNPEAVPRVKGIINRAIKKRQRLNVTNSPDPKSIAIVTNKWHRNHAVYKSAGPLVEQLVGKYKLTLIWTGPRMPDTAVTNYFDKVVKCHFVSDGNMTVPDEVLDNDFQMVYFPDIGMTDESIWLSNMRLAPIQAVGYGHPDTTGADNEIDYFIGGDVEKHSTSAYAETMVLLPGLAQEPAWPTAERKHNYNTDAIVRVNCVWGPDKYNYSLLKMLEGINKAVMQRTGAAPTHEFHLFGSPGMNRYGALPAFTRDVQRMLPNAILHTQQEYYDYMENAEQHDFSLNSFPFGCYNVLIESLYMGLPFLTLVGERFYNRAGMWLNDQVDMSENNFQTAPPLIEKAATLITNPDELKRQRAHLAGIDLKERLFTLKGNHFLEAVEYIIANHPFHETKIIGDDK